MARARLIKPALAKNDVLAELGPHAQLLFALLPCHADRDGRLEDRPNRIKAEVFPYYDVDCDALLDSLANCSEKFIVRYEVDGIRYIQIAKFETHQRPHHKETESVIPPQAMLASCLDQVSPKHDNPDSEASNRDKYKNRDKNRDEVQATGDEGDEAEFLFDPLDDDRQCSPEEPNPPDAGESVFDAFWEAVPNKIAKADAAKAHVKALGTIAKDRGISRPEAAVWLLERMQAFAESPKARSEFCPHPTTWLNSGRYDDDPETWKAQRNGSNALEVVVPI